MRSTRRHRHAHLVIGQRSWLVTNAGGPAILAADALEAEGLVIPEFSTGLRQRIAESLLEPDFQTYPHLVNHSRRVSSMAENLAGRLKPARHLAGEALARWPIAMAYDASAVLR